MRKPTLFSRLDGIFGALSRGHRRHHKGIKPPGRRTFALEPLEDRRLLTLCTWTGAVSNYMSNAGNWNQVPVWGANDDIKIAGSNTTVIDDFGIGMQFNSIEIANNAQITGNPIVVLNGIKADPGVSATMAMTSNPGFMPPITLGGATNTIEVDAGASLNLNCQVTSAGTLTKTGAGILGLTTDGQFAGVTISTGALQVVPGSVQCANFGNIDNEGTLIYNSGPTYFGGTISGWGSNYAITLPVEPGGVTSSEVSDAGVRYGSGDNIVSFTTPDLTATYNVQSAAVDLGAGYGWQLDTEPYLVQQIDGTVTVVLSQQEAYTFDLVGGNYVPAIGVQQSLTHNTSNQTFTFETTDGRTCVFNDFSSSGPGAGQLVQQDYNGIRMQVGDWVDSSGYIVTGDCYSDKIMGVYYYHEGYSIPFQSRGYYYYGNGRLSCVVTYDITVNTEGPVYTPITQTVLNYYAGPYDGYAVEGSAGDLTYAKSQNYDLATNAWVTDQVFGFTYYTGYDAHELKMAYSPQGTYDLGNVVWWNSDSQIEPYSSVYYQYNAYRAVSWAEIAGKYDESYSYGGDVYGGDVTTVSTSSYYWDSVCTNDLGQVIFSTLYQYSGTTTNTYNVYGSDTYDDGELLDSFTSAAISSFYWSGSTPVITVNDTGLVNVYRYYSSGDQEGMLYQAGVQEGGGGTPIWTTYYEYTASLDSWNNGMALSYVSNPEVACSYYTSASYSGGLAVTDYPAVNEGSSADAISDVWYCGENPVWSMDAMGKFTYNEYDETGVLVETIQDISSSMAASLSLTPPVTLPSTGLNATTDYGYDSQGRSIQVLGPAHNVNGTSERAATWMVYNPSLEADWYSTDQSDEDPNPNATTVLAANGYVTQDGDGNWTVATVDNPVSITTYGSQGQITNAITASYSGSLANFLSANVTTFAQSDLLTWTSYDYNTSYWALSGSIGSHLNSGKGYCLLLDSKTYFDIPASGTGAVCVNYDETTYGYDDAGRLNYEEDPNGTVTTMSLDAFGNVLDIDKGTTSGTALVSAYTYNSDGLMTTDTEYTAGYGSGRVTTFEYNWQDELEYAINPLDSDGRRTYTAYTYDDLGNVTEVQTYWAYDPNVVPGPDGSPGPNDKLTSDVAYAYDAREQLYQTTTYPIDPVNFGRSDATPEYTYYWYDQAGNVIKTERLRLRCVHQVHVRRLGRIDGHLHRL